MSRRTRLIAVIVISLVVVGAWVSAQVVGVPSQNVGGPIISGSDLGFLVETRRESAVVGRLMVRVDGKWVEADFAAAVRKLQSH